MCDNLDENSVHGLGSVVNCCQTQKMYDQPVDTCPFESDSVPDWYLTQDLSDKLVSKDPFVLKHCHDKYKTEEMCDKAIDLCIPALKFVPAWFVTSKTIENLESAVFCNDYTVLGELDSRWRWKKKK